MRIVTYILEGQETEANGRRYFYGPVEANGTTLSELIDNAVIELQDQQGYSSHYEKVNDLNDRQYQKVVEELTTSFMNLN